jgi:hypothetical protein
VDPSYFEPFEPIEVVPASVLRHLTDGVMGALKG